MSKQQAIRNAARAVKAHGFTLPADLEKQISGLENPQYRVAVVGEFQVGKSTLINRVFLGDKPLLTEGRGSCTTAVATDIEYGSTSTLEVYDWTDATRTGETLTKTVPNPTEADVNDATASRDMEKRAELAKKRARVVVKIPNEALRGFTVIDTPGLDDPNQELLLETTWRIIPSADVALLVVRGNMALGDRERGLLRKEIMGRNGISRLMVLASFNPKTMDQDQEGREDICDTIKADLTNMGRDNIPVEMYCFDSSVEDIMSDVAEIRMTIRQFLADNALPGREEKIANLLRIELEKDLANIATKIATVGKSEVDRAALAARVEAEVARFKEKAELAFDRFQDKVKELGDNTRREVEFAIDAVFEEFYRDLAEKENVGAMRNFIERGKTTIKSDLSDKISIINLKLKSDIERIVDRYGNDMEECREGWNVFISDEFEIKKPVAAKIPPVAIKTIEVVLLNLILPFGWITAIIAKIVLGDNFSPVDWATRQMILQGVKKNLEEAKPDTLAQIMQQVEAGIQKTFNDVKTAMESSNRAQVEAIRAALAASPAESADRAALESAKADLESALAAL